MHNARSMDISVEGFCFALLRCLGEIVEKANAVAKGFVSKLRDVKGTAVPWPPSFSSLSDAEAKAEIKTLVDSNKFDLFYGGKFGQTFPIALLKNNIMTLLGTDQRILLLSIQTIEGHGHHPEIRKDEYKLI